MVQRITLGSVFVSLALSSAGCGGHGQEAEPASDSTRQALTVAPMGFARINATGAVVDQYNGTSRYLVSVSRPATGQYGVTFRQLGLSGGHVQVVAEGANNTRCRVGSWDRTPEYDQKVNVRCHRPDGTPIDAAFAVLYYRLVRPAFTSSAPTTNAYVWVAGDGRVDPAYDYNSSGWTHTVSKTGPGAYRVTVTNARDINASIMVTAYGRDDTNFCGVSSWGLSGGSVSANVRCWTSSGVLIDTAFTLAYNTTGPTFQQQGGHAWFDGTSTPATYASALGNSIGCSSASVSGSRSGSLARVLVQGNLGMWNPGPDPWDAGDIPLTPLSFKRASFVTAHGSTPSYCKVESLAAYGIEDGVTPNSTANTAVRCYDAAGAILPTPTFTFTHVTSDRAGPC